MSGELLRKLIHIGAAAPILLVPLLRTWGSVAVCGAAVFFNLFILPRTSAGKKIRREDEGFPWEETDRVNEIKRADRHR